MALVETNLSAVVLHEQGNYRWVDPLLSDNDSIPSLSDNDLMPELCTRFKIKSEIDIAVSYLTAQIQEADDSLSNILFKEMIRRIGDLRLFEGDCCQTMLVLD